MAASTRPRASDDAGSVLVMVLVFVTVVGLLTVALLETTGATLVSSSVTKHNLERVSAVNGGVDIGIQALRGGAPCTGSLVQGAPLEGHPVQVSCADLGAVLAGQRLALVATSTEPDTKTVKAIVEVTLAADADRTATIVSWSVVNP